MTTPSGGSTSDDYWRRPDTGDDAVADQPPTAPAATPPAGGPATGYSGPPPSVAPPAGWRPPVHLQPVPPRQLPPQDMAGLDAAEQRSQRVTYGFGAAAGVVLLVLLCLLCSRVIF
ncbi:MULTISPECIES: hypothetical protein [Micromonospora]|uniref:hypothetical protein n=1 Tax=Micromonospora TaxID=1873 RepID=UPI001EE8AC9E|nr:MULTISPECIES: hypothetical protein [Micromonospora]MCG5449004.1 hypothetical protein [Micromonospora hortensis]MCX5118910.1 hypothetical protein [Micromonospora sp. NBC_00362]WTI08958.1 hypothetical protein OHB44_04520 [Micromonospora sp. NBC_00821]